MDDDVTRFTAIKGIGKRTDARLHEAGVETWHSLAEVLMALSTPSARLRASASGTWVDRRRSAPPAPETVRPRRHATSSGRTASSSRSPSTPLEQHSARASPTFERGAGSNGPAGSRPRSSGTSSSGPGWMARRRPHRLVRRVRSGPGVPPRNSPGLPPHELYEPGGLDGRSSRRPRRPSASAARSAVDRGRSRSWSSCALRVRRHRRPPAHRPSSSTPRSVSVRSGRPRFRIWRGHPRPRRSRSSPSSSLA